MQSAGLELLHGDSKAARSGKFLMYLYVFGKTEK